MKVGQKNCKGGEAGIGRRQNKSDTSSPTEIISGKSPARMRTEKG